MHLDIRTLLVAIALATAFCAGARFLLWRMHPEMPGLARWAWASALGAVALALIATRGVFPEWLSLSLAQALIAAGFVLAWDGFRRFLDRPPLPWHLLAVIAAAVAGAILFSHLVPPYPDASLTPRSVSNALLIAAISALIARELLSASAPGQVAARAGGWLYAVNALFFLLRAVAAARGAPPPGPLNPDGLAALPALWWLCMTVAATLVMVLMAGERLQAELDRQASCDPLTGAFNRRAFTLMAQKEVAWARRSGQPLAVMMMDLDHFKQINDRLGHGGGDQMLCRFVATAEGVLRSEDLFCRFGGEEFVALLPGATAGRALEIGERLRGVFAEEAARALDTSRPLPFPVTVSIGVGEARPEEALDALVARADAALYRAKEGGRNRCELAEEAPEPDAGLALEGAPA